MPELKQANRFYPAALASYETGVAAPSLPEFYAVGEFITRRILQAVTGEMPVKQALDTAADETDGIPQGARLLQVTFAAVSAARFPVPTGVSGCSCCRVRSCWARSCCFRSAMQST